MMDMTPNLNGADMLYTRDTIFVRIPEALSRPICGD